MEQYIYRGETERAFELAMIRAVGIENVWYREGEEAGTEPDEPLGVILVAKDYDDSWIASRRFFLDWEIVHAPVAAKCVKGFDDPHWSVIGERINDDDCGGSYILYQSPTGEIVAETLSSEFVIAPSPEAFRAMTEEEVARICRARETGAAR